MWLLVAKRVSAACSGRKLFFGFSVIRLNAQRTSTENKSQLRQVLISQLLSQVSSRCLFSVVRLSMLFYSNFHTKQYSTEYFDIFVLHF